MKVPRIAAAVLGSMIFGASLSYAQKSDYGKRDYDDRCAVCHGVGGKGDGPYKPFLTRPPSDLTILAKRNNSVLPVSRIYQILDGRLEVAAHGPREMPIWGIGSYYLIPVEPTAGQAAMETNMVDRILAMIDYINRMQTK